MSARERQLEAALQAQQEQIHGLRRAFGDLTRTLGYDIEALAREKSRMLRSMLPTPLAPQEPTFPDGQTTYSFQPGLGGYDGTGSYFAVAHGEWQPSWDD